MDGGACLVSGRLGDGAPLVTSAVIGSRTQEELQLAAAAAARPSPQSPAITPVGAYDHVFYGGMAIAMALTVLTGFAPTYYLRFFGDGPRATLSGGPFTSLVHLHGALFTSWVLLFVVQTALVASHRVAVHRRLGVGGAALAAAMVLVGTVVAIVTAARGGAPAGVDPLAFLAIPIFDMALFATFVTTALVMRRDKEAHKRLMLLAYISIIVAAVARLPGVQPMGPLAFFGFGYLFVVVAVIYDLVSRRRVHKAYLWGGGLLVASVPLRLMVSGTGVWRGFAEFVTK
jgi:FtsH-binding integral membrane protein